MFQLPWFRKKVKQPEIDEKLAKMTKLFPQLPSGDQVSVLSILEELISPSEDEKSDEPVPSKGGWAKILAIVFMIIPVGLSLLTYSEDIDKSILFFKWKETVKFSMAPGLLSTIAGILLYSSLVIRRREEILSDWRDIILTCLNILFCASFVNIFISKELWNIPFINVSSQSFLFIAIIASWLCIPTIAGFIWIALFIMSIIQMSTASNSMGSAGAIYAISAFLGIIFQLKAAGNIKGIFASLKNDFLGAAGHVSADVSSSVCTAKDIAKKISAMKNTI